MVPRSDGPPAPAGDADRASRPAGDGSGEEQRVGGSPLAQAANGAILALSRAARSFTLYDPANKVVRVLIADYREKMQKAFETHGALAFDIHPFELLLGKEVVYVERDRERSLSFRLFRDGVRRLVFEPTVTWDEMLRLLEIFSIRYTGVRQQEEDLVTLLRKAGFKGISIAAIEGFVPDEELQETPLDAGALRASTARFAFPRQWDLPIPPFKEMAPVEYRSVGPELLGPLRAEEAPETVPANALAAVSELLGTAARPEDLDALLVFATEVRDFLVVEGEAAGLLALVRTCRAALAAAPEKAQVFLKAFLDDRTLRAIVRGQPGGSDEVPPALVEVLDMAPGDVLELLLDLLAAEGEGPRAGLLRRLVARAAKGSPDVLLARLRGAESGMAAVLLGVLHEIDPHRAVHAEFELAPRADKALQLEILRRLETVPFDAEVGRTFRELLASSSEDVRVRCLEELAARGGPRVFHTIQAHLEKHAGSATDGEAAAAGRALVQASPAHALELFQGWLPAKTGGLFGRIVHASAPHALQRAAFAGLERIAGAEAEALLAHLAAHGDEDVRRSAAAEQVARRHSTPGGAAGG